MDSSPSDWEHMETVLWKISKGCRYKRYYDTSNDENVEAYENKWVGCMGNL